MKSMLRVGVLCLAAAATGAAMAATDHEKEQLATYERFAGPRLDEMPFWRMQGFETLGDYEVLVFTGINDAFLVKVLPPCSRLRYASSLGLTSNLHRVHVKFDHLVAGGDRCNLYSIQKVDYKAYRAERKANAAEGEAASKK